MRGRLAVVLGGLGVAGAFVARALRRQTAPTDAPATIEQGDPRAEELRRKLEESRAIAQERDEFEEAELTVDQAEPLGDPDARRRGVHDAGKSALERMRGNRNQQ